jgi:iron complex transport system ATP-binding protein
MNAPLLEVAALRYAYHLAQPVLQSASLAVHAGTVTAILGPNGVGKTTLLKLILGLLTPLAGSIKLAGMPLAHYSRQQLAQQIAWVPQQEAISFPFSVLEYVLLGRAPYLRPFAQPGAYDRKLAFAALQEVGLESLQERTVTELSGGQKQLVTIARALAQAARLMLLDEPTASLDLSNRGRVLALIRQLAQHQRAVIFTTHDPNSAAAVADQLILVKQGQVLAAGPTEQLLEAELLSATYGVPVQVAELAGKRVVLDAPVQL